MQLLLLDNRKIYSTDKVKIRLRELKCQNEETIREISAARAKLPPTADRNVSAHNKEQPSSPPRKRNEVNCAENSGDSSSSVEHPVIGLHTGDEEEVEVCENDGNYHSNFSCFVLVMLHHQVG